jgi:hypothetical protein
MHSCSVLPDMEKDVVGISKFQNLGYEADNIMMYIMKNVRGFLA